MSRYDQIYFIISVCFSDSIDFQDMTVLCTIADRAFWPIFFIATIAALIASRAMTTATFSCIKQSIALGCFPRLKIVHTSRKFMGQIYIPVINWFLLVFCVAFVVMFGSIYEIGNAYGEYLPIFPLVFCIKNDFLFGLLFMPQCFEMGVLNTV